MRTEAIFSHGRTAAVMFTTRLGAESGRTREAAHARWAFPFPAPDSRNEATHLRATDVTDPAKPAIARELRVPGVRGGDIRVRSVVGEGTWFTVAFPRAQLESRRTSVIIIVMGVAGSGKTTIGRMLADAMRCPFLDGDSLHPDTNIDAMRRGVPLTDADRMPWLAAIRDRMVESHRRGEPLVVACSALRQSYRTYLAEGLAVTWVYLRGAPELLESRLDARRGHFARSELLASQLETLEEPGEAIVADIGLPPGEIVRQVVEGLPLDDA